MFFKEELRPLPEHDAKDGITYDRFGRMQYHPEFHHAHGQSYKTEDLEYLCAFYESDNTRSLSFALGKPEHLIRTKYSELKKQGLVEMYRANYWSRYEKG